MNNHLPPQILEHNKRSRYMTFGIQVLASYRHEHMAGLNLCTIYSTIHNMSTARIALDALHQLRLVQSLKT